MKILKHILIGLGVAFLLLIGFLSYMAVESGDFAEEHTPFVRQFITDFSRDWDVRDVQHLLTNDFIEQMETPSGRKALALFKRLGRLVAIQDIALDNFNTHFGTASFTQGTFVFEAEFEHAVTQTTLLLVVNKKGQRVQGLRINPTGKPDRSIPNFEI